jgi:hypothetical protein
MTPGMPRRIPTLFAIIATLPAVDLPVTNVVIAPDGAWVERSGTLPAGDGEIAGLPESLDSTSANLLIDRMPTPWLQIAPPPVPADPAIGRRSELMTAMTAIRARVDQAEQRTRLAQLAAGQPGDARADGGKLPPISPQAWEAHRAAVLAQLAAARSERLAAERELAAASAALDALSVPARPRGLRVGLTTAPVDRQVRLSYRLREATWSLAWRCVVGEHAAELIPVATVRVRSGDDWGTAPVRLVTRRSQGPVGLGDLQVRSYGLPEAVGGLERPRLVEVVAGDKGREEAVADSEMGGQGAFMAIGAGGGSSGMFGQRSSGGRKRAVAAHGGSKGSESAVDAGLRQGIATQAADGSFATGPYRTECTALVLLSLLGAGYDHKTPNRYRDRIAKSLVWLQAQSAGSQSLTGTALGTMVLAEAYAMTGDPGLRQPCETWRDQLVSIVAAGALDTAAADSAPLQGGFAAALVVMAGKSCLAAGLEVDVKELARRAGDAAARVADPTDRVAAEGVIRVMTGRQAEIPDSVFAAVAARIAAFTGGGRIHTVYLLNLAAFQMGGDIWKQWNGTVRDHLAALQAGGVPPSHTAGPVASGALMTLCLQVYYRYAPVDSRARSGQSTPTVTVLPNPAEAAQQWPVAYDLPAGTRLLDRNDTVVDLAPIRLEGRLQRHAFPVADNAVWRRFTADHAGPAPLPAGLCTVIVDGNATGSVALPFTPPGGRVVVSAGIDQRLTIERTVAVTSVDGWLSGREATVTVTDVVNGPPGTDVAVTVSEPLPRPREGIAIEMLSPALTGRAAAERLAKDPFQRADLGVGGSLGVSYRLSYATDVRPVLEIAP